MENLYTKDCIRTYTGLYMNVFEPTPEMICIEDIVHALSYMPRFGGHLPKFYSVAEHSLIASTFARPENKFEALCHDFSEAYLMDMPSPIKKRLGHYKEIEENLMHVIAKKFGFSWPMSEAVMAIDKKMVNLEWDELMLGKTKTGFFINYQPENIKYLLKDCFDQLSKLQHPGGVVGDANAYC